VTEFEYFWGVLGLNLNYFLFVLSFTYINDHFLTWDVLPVREMSVTWMYCNLYMLVTDTISLRMPKRRHNI
jgi:hypothetical protein